MGVLGSNKLCSKHLDENKMVMVECKAGTVGTRVTEEHSVRSTTQQCMKNEIWAACTLRQPELRFFTLTFCPLRNKSSRVIVWDYCNCHTSQLVKKNFVGNDLWIFNMLGDFILPCYYLNFISVPSVLMLFDQLVISLFWVFICCGFSEKHLLGKVLHKYNYYTIVSSISLMFDAKYEARAGSHLA